MRKFDKVSASLSFSSKYCRAVAENAIKPLIFMYHEAVSILVIRVRFSSWRVKQLDLDNLDNKDNY